MSEDAQGSVFSHVLSLLAYRALCKYHTCAQLSVIICSVQERKTYSCSPISLIWTDLSLSIASVLSHRWSFRGQWYVFMSTFRDENDLWSLMSHKRFVQLLICASRTNTAVICSNRWKLKQPFCFKNCIRFSFGAWRTSFVLLTSVARCHVGGSYNYNDARRLKIRISAAIVWRAETRDNEVVARFVKGQVCWGYEAFCIRCHQLSVIWLGLTLTLRHSFILPSPSLTPCTEFHETSSMKLLRKYV